MKFKNWFRKMWEIIPNSHEEEMPHVSTVNLRVELGHARVSSHISLSLINIYSYLNKIWKKDIKCPWWLMASHYRCQNTGLRLAPNRCGTFFPLDLVVKMTALFGKLKPVETGLSVLPLWTPSATNRIDKAVSSRSGQDSVDSGRMP